MRKHVAALAAALTLAVAVVAPHPTTSAQEATQNCSVDPALVAPFTLSQEQYEKLLATPTGVPVKFHRSTILLHDVTKTEGRTVITFTAIDRKGNSEDGTITCTAV